MKGSAFKQANQYLQSSRRQSVPTAIVYFADTRRVNIIQIEKSLCSCRHTAIFDDPVPVAQQIRANFGTTIVAVGVPGINGLLKPVDVQVEAFLLVCENIKSSFARNCIASPAIPQMCWY